MLIPTNGEIPHDARVWIFGYASLIWKPGFEYQRRVLGYVEGFSRRFWQTNATHRGTLDKPGRVATLVPDTEGTVWGLAYEVVGRRNIQEAMKHLNGREVTSGYCLMLADFHPAGETETSLPVLAFTATERNQHYSTTSLNKLARQVIAAEGPSGHNVEYVLRIVDFMREHVGSEHDKHLWELDRLIRTLLTERDMVVTDLIGDGPKCDCDKQLAVIHRKKCPTKQWALHRRDILKTVSSSTHSKSYTDLSEIFVKGFTDRVSLHSSSSVGIPRWEHSKWTNEEQDFQRTLRTEDLNTHRAM